MSKTNKTNRILTALEVKAFKPKTKKYKKRVDKNLYVLIDTTGNKYWLHVYSINNKQQNAWLGAYPKISLAKAIKRNKQLQLDKLNGDDPKIRAKQYLKPFDVGSDNTFKSIAIDWHNKEKDKWTENYAKKVMWSLENNVFDIIGNKSIELITRQELVKILQMIEKNGSLNMIPKIRQRLKAICTYALDIGLLDTNHALNLEKTTKNPDTSKNFKHLKFKIFHKLVKAIDSYQGELTTINGLKIIMHTFVRSSELRFAKWNEINFKKKKWTIPAQRMKMKRAHIVPLSKQVIKLFKELKPLTGHYDYIFASRSKPNLKPMSENAMLNALNNLGYKGKMTVHGFRHIATTRLNEKGFNYYHIDKQLSHENKDKVGKRYNKAQYIKSRTKIMQYWSNLIDKQREK